jgi:hypothetical protein
MKCSIWSGVRNSYFSIAMVNAWTRFLRTTTLVKGCGAEEFGATDISIEFEVQEMQTFISSLTE